MTNGVLSVTAGAIGTTSALNVGTTSASRGTLNFYASGTTATINLAANADLTVGASTGALQGGLGFDLSGSSSDTLVLTGAGAGQGTVTVGTTGALINALALAPLTPGSFTLIDATGGGQSGTNITNVAGFALGTLTGGYHYSLDTSTPDTLKLTVTALTGAAASGPYYWTGARPIASWAALTGNGTQSNWSTTQAGTSDPQATPGNVLVVFSADNAGSSAINTTLDQSYSVTGLRFISNSPAAATGNVSIASGTGGALTIGASGIDIQTGASSTTTAISAPVVLNGAQLWNVTDPGETLTVTGSISGNGFLLTKNGSGTLALNDSAVPNTFTGGVTINGGKVQISTATSLGTSAGTATIGTSGTLEATQSIVGSRNFVLGGAGSTILVDSPQTYQIVNTASSKISGGSGVLNATGAGTLVLDDRLDANTFGGGSVLGGGGTVKIFTNTSLGSGAVTVNNATLEAGATISDSSRNYTIGNANSAIKVDAGSVFTITNGASTNLSGTGVLNTTGPGTLVLNDSANANSFNGGSVLGGGGKVKINTVTSLGSGAITIGNATLEATAAISDVGRNYTLSNANSTLTVDTGTYTISNSGSTKITGTGALNANGPGTLVVDDSANPNDFSGGTVITGTGTVKIDTATSLGASSGAVTLGNATLEATATISGSRNFFLQSFGGSKISVDNTMAYAIGGVIADGNQSGTLNAIGQGTLNLTTTVGNTYTGGTFVSGGGTLRVNNTAGSGTGTGAVSVTGTGTTLGGTGSISGTTTIGSGAILAPGNPVGTLTTGGLILSAGSQLNYELGAIASSDKTVVSGTNPVNFTANGGQFNFTPVSTLASGTYHLITYNGTLGGIFSNLSSASSYLTDTSNTVFYVQLANNAGSVDLVSTNNLTWNGNVPGTVWDNGTTANWQSGGTTGLKFFNTMGATFDDTATNFTVNVASAGVAPSAIVVNNTINTYTFQGTGAITDSTAGPTGLTKSGGADLFISNANTFSGNTIINTGGGIDMQNAAALGTTGSITVNTGGALRLSGSIAVGAKALSLAGAGDDGFGALRSVSGSNSYAGNITLAAASTIGSTNGTLTLGGSGTISSVNLGLTITGAGTTIINDGINLGTGGITVNAAGNVTINGAITSGRRRSPSREPAPSRCPPPTPSAGP